MGSSPAKDERDETQAERDDRNLIELLQELRVGGLGVQVLFGFLLSLPFTSQFKQLDGSDRDLYLACLILAAVATAILLGQAAYLRVVFRPGEMEQLVSAAIVKGILCLAAVALLM